MNYLVTVIVPVYKVEKYLDRCVESIVKQTYSNLEIILVDDGSPDACPEICERWAAQDGRITVIHQKNQGLSAARNAGIDVAKGEFLCFIDSDDYIMPTMIDKLCETQEKYRTKLVITNFKCVTDDGDRVHAKEESPIRSGVFQAREIFPKLYRYLNWYFIVAWNKLYHKSLFEDLRFPVGRIHEDEYIISQVLWKAGNIACIGEEEYIYIFKRPGAIMAETQKVRYHHLFEALELRHDFYLEKKLPEEARATRQRFIADLEHVCCKSPNHAGLTAEQLTLAKKRYSRLKQKSIKEKLYWAAFFISPKAAFFISHRLRDLFKKKKKR